MWKTRIKIFFRIFLPLQKNGLQAFFDSWNQRVLVSSEGCQWSVQVAHGKATVPFSIMLIAVPIEQVILGRCVLLIDETMSDFIEWLENQKLNDCVSWLCSTEVRVIFVVLLIWNDFMSNSGSGSTFYFFLGLCVSNSRKNARDKWFDASDWNLPDCCHAHDQYIRRNDCHGKFLPQDTL